MKKITSQQYLEVLVHVIAWCYFFLSPLLFRHSNEVPDWANFFRYIVIPLGTFFVFYLNYFVLVPKLLLVDKRKIKMFIVCNLLMAIVMAFGFEMFIHFIMPPIDPHSTGDAMDLLPGMEGGGHGRGEVNNHIAKRMHRMGHPHGHHPPKGILPLYGFVRNSVTMLGFAIAAVCIRLSLRWHQSELAFQKSEAARAEIEAAHQKSEAARADAELKVLQHQVSPHFLLNCLNNIYSLISFDTKQAQNSLVELSRILRYQLYESNSKQVLLSKEIEFLQNYISLMRIRLSDNTEVTTDFSYDESKHLLIAPNILISLVENAFKHGVSPTDKSFVRIVLNADDNQISLCCENSNYPKNPNVDKSGGGLGLQQVAQMLELNYKGKYEWKRGVSEDGNVYTSNIIITL